MNESPTFKHRTGEICFYYREDSCDIVRDTFTEDLWVTDTGFMAVRKWDEFQHFCTSMMITARMPKAQDLSEVLRNHL